MPEGLTALFVYGTLGPTGSRSDLLQRVEGTYEEATIRAHHDHRGWGCTGGYPGVILDEEAPLLKGWVYRSRDLHSILPAVDRYEGSDYERVEVAFTTKQSSGLAFTYVLHSRHHPTLKSMPHLWEKP